MDDLDFETLAVHGGGKTRIGGTLSTIPPIVASTTFVYDSVDQVHEALAPEGSGYAYARNANPTVVALEKTAALLESADVAVAFGSGMAAIHAVFAECGSEGNRSILAASDLYGVTRSLLAELTAAGFAVHYTDVLDLAVVEAALAQLQPAVLYFETMSNPLLRVPDAQSLQELGTRFGATVVVDNTFCTPYLYRPLCHGADVVVHSATKYIAGHGDVVAGLVATDAERGARIRSRRTLTGGVLSPFEAWLTLRGMRTLPLRMERHCQNAAFLANWLTKKAWVKQVHYPGLAHHPQHHIAASQFGGRFGGMLAIELESSRRGTLNFIDALSVITPGTSLGDAESLILYPPLSSHRTLSSQALETAGIGSSLVRLSVGLEKVNDLAADLEQAADRAIETIHRQHHGHLG